MLLRDMTKEDFDYACTHAGPRGVLGKLHEKTDWAYAVEHNGETLLVGGVDKITDTTAWCWLHLTDIAMCHVQTVYRIIKEWIDELAVIHGIKRMMAFVEDGFAEGARFIEHLGFESEHYMPRFLESKAAILYVKFYNGDDYDSLE